MISRKKLHYYMGADQRSNFEGIRNDEKKKQRRTKR